MKEKVIYKKMFKEGGLGIKVFYTMDNIGRAKYTVSKHDGKSTHKDGSPFFDIDIFKSKKALYEYITELVNQGYVYSKEHQ